MESILMSIKKLIGIDDEYKHYDPDIISHINDVFMTLDQLGVEVKEPYIISSDVQTWKQLFGNDVVLNEALKTYIYVEVKLVFDPPTVSAVLEALEKKGKEAEWRINHRIEFKKKEG